MVGHSFPKYLTEKMVILVVNTTLQMVTNEKGLMPEGLAWYQHLHIVILVPVLSEASSQYPHHQVQPGILYERSVGDKCGWTRPYDEIARRNALQLWQERIDSESGNNPHFLFFEDALSRGGVKRRGLVVACAGTQPWFDRMVAGIIADVLIALAHDAYEKRREKALAL
jgi:hypothetical protein